MSQLSMIYYIVGMQRRPHRCVRETAKKRNIQALMVVLSNEVGGGRGGVVWDQLKLWRPPPPTPSRWSQVNGMDLVRARKGSEEYSAAT